MQLHQGNIEELRLSLAEIPGRLAKAHTTKDQKKDKSMIDPQRMGTSPLASLLVSFYRIWRGALKLKGTGYMLGQLAPF